MTAGPADGGGVEATVIGAVVGAAAVVGAVGAGVPNASGFQVIGPAGVTVGAAVAIGDVVGAGAV
jgi:hypothetical protein